MTLLLILAAILYLLFLLMAYAFARASKHGDVLREQAYRERRTDARW
jgi:hypothetical protein